MKITNRQIVSIFNGMPKIMGKRLPVKLGFAINKNMASMKGTAESYDAERAKILDKYGEKDESGKIRIESGEYVLKDREGFGDEMKELLDIETEIPVHTVGLDEIEKCDSEKFDSLTPDELSLLEFMIEE